MKIHFIDDFNPFQRILAQKCVEIVEICWNRMLKFVEMNWISGLNLLKYIEMNRISWLKSVEMNGNSRLKFVEINRNSRLKICWNKLNFVQDISNNINIIDIAGRRSSCWFCRPACSPVRWNWRLGSRQQEVDVDAAGLEEIPGAAAASSGTWGKECAALSRDTSCRDWVGAHPLPLYNSTGRSPGASFGRGERYVLHGLSQEV